MPKLESVDTVETVPVADRVTDELRASILAGRLAPAHEFSLRHIATELGVSFIPVREALRTLEAEGLLITQRGRSATVMPLSHEELDSAFRLRKLIEPELAGIAATMHSAEDLAELTNLLAVCKDPTTSPDQHAAAHIDFHLGLLQPAATNVDQRLLTALIQATSRYARRIMEPLGTAPEQHLAQDPQRPPILDAFHSHDPATARAAMLRIVNQHEALCRKAVPASDRSGRKNSV